MEDCQAEFGDALLAVCLQALLLCPGCDMFKIASSCVRGQSVSRMWLPSKQEASNHFSVFSESDSVEKLSCSNLPAVGSE